MNRKGLIGTVVILILALLLLVIGFRILGITLEVGKDTLDELIPDFGPFNPYKAEPQDLADITVDNSIKATVCSINAAGMLDEQIRDDFYDIDRTGITMEEYLSRVPWKNFWKRACPEGEFQEIEEEKENICTLNMGTCVNALRYEKGHFDKGDYDPDDPGNEDYCPQERPFCEITCPFTWGDRCTGGDKECRGDYASKCMETGYLCEMQCVTYTGAGKVGRCIEEDGVRCSNSEGNFEIEESIEKANSDNYCGNGVLYGGTCVTCEPEDNSFVCKVDNFFLPQPGIDDKNVLDAWINFPGDPQYLVYYEAFPEGEDAYWTPAADSLAPHVLVGGAAFSLIWPVSDDVSEVLSKGGSFDELFETTTLGKLNNFRKKIFRYGEATDELAARLDLIEAGTYKVFTEDLDNLVDDAFEYDHTRVTNLVRNSQDAGRSRWDLIDDLAEDISTQSGLNLDDSLTIATRLESRVITPAFEGSVDVAKAKVARNLDVSLSHFLGKGEIDDEALKLFLRNNHKTGDAWVDLVAGEYVEADAFLDALRQTDPTKAQYYAPLTSLYKATDEIKNAPIVNNNVDKVAKRIVDAVPNWRQSFTFMAKSFDTERRFGTMMLFYIVGNMMDMQNQKFYPQGKDAFVVRNPTFFDNAAIYDLSADEYSLYLRNNDKIQGFYMASPCRAELEIRPKKIETKINEAADMLLYDIYDFGSGPITVKKGTLNYESESSLNYGENWRISSSREAADELGSRFTYVSELLEHADGFFKEAVESDSYENKLLNYRKALSYYVIIGKHYPLSSQATKANEKIEAMLNNPRIFLLFSPESLQELAFETVMSDEIREEVYAQILEDFAEEKADAGATIGREAEYDCYEASDDPLIPSDCESLLSKSNWKDIYFMIDPFDDDMIGVYELQMSDDKDTLFEKYRETLFYIYVSPDYCNLDTLYGAPGPCSETESDYISRLEEWESLPYEDFPLSVSNNLDDTWYETGLMLIPSHARHRKTMLNGVAVQLYPNWVEYKEEYIPAYEEYENSPASSLGDSQLVDMKKYYETRARANDIDGEDIARWIQSMQELQDRGLVDEEEAVKIVNPIDKLFEKNIDDVSLWSSGLEVETQLMETDSPNYCYQEYSQTAEYMRVGFTVASLFADEVVGSFAAAQCGAASFGLGAPACYKIASAATNLGFAAIDRELTQRQRWPCRGKGKCIW